MGLFDRSVLTNNDQNTGETASIVKLETILEYIADLSDVNYNFAAGLISSAALSRLGWYNVTDYGAEGDYDASTNTGTDDTTAIQDALDVASTNTNGMTVVFIPAGSYLVSGLIMYSNTILVGEGVLYQKPDVATAIITNENAFDGGTDHDIHVIGVTFDGNSSNYTSDLQNFLIQFNAVDKCQISRCIFRNLRSINTGGGKSLMLQIGSTSKHYIISNCHFESAGTSSVPGNGIFAKGRHGVIANCTAKDVFDTPYNFERMTNGTMVGNIAENCGNGYGVTLDCENISVVGNVADTCAAFGVAVDAFTASGGTYCRNITIEGNVLKNSGHDGSGNGIECKDAQNVIVKGNVVDTAFNYGIRIFNCSLAVVEGNTVTNCNGVGVYSAGGTVRFKFMGNVVFDNNTSSSGSGFGLRIDATTEAEVKNNTFYDTNGTAKQRGIFINSDVERLYYKGNNTFNLLSTILQNNAVLTKELVKKGTTAQRPTLNNADDIGQLYLDTTLAASGKPIWWTGSAWVDNTGTTV